MLQLPTLPTDSLYKFLFIAGVVLNISAFFLMTQRYQKLKIGDDQSDSSYTTLKIKLKGIETDKKVLDIDPIVRMYDDLNNQIRLNVNKLKTKGLNKVEKEIINEKINRLKEETQKFSRQNRQVLDRYSSKLIYEMNKLDSIEAVQSLAQKKFDGVVQSDKFDKVYIDFMFGIGSFCMIFGGILWYLLIQRFQDIILKIQAEQLIIEKHSKLKTIGRAHFEPKILPYSSFTRNRKE